MKYKRLVILLVIGAILLWGVGYFRINLVYRETEFISYHEGDLFHYQGMDITVGSLERYSAEEFERKTGKSLSLRDRKDTLVVVANLHVKNVSGRDLVLKSGLQHWQIETEDFYCNGQSYELTEKKNFSYKKDSNMDCQLYFTFHDGSNFQGGLKRLRESSMRIYISYYPEARYIQY